MNLFESIANYLTRSQIREIDLVLKINYRISKKRLIKFSRFQKDTLNIQNLRELFDR